MQKKKVAQDITLMLLPSGGGAVRKYVITARMQLWLRRGAYATAGTLAVLLVVSMLAARHTGEFFALRERVALQKEYLVRADHRLGDLQDQVDRMRIFEQKLRIVLGQSPAPTGEELVGLGGPEDDLDLPVQSEESAMVGRMESGFLSSKVEGSLAEIGLQELHNLMEDQSSLLSSTPSIWPVHGWVTSHFGGRTSPFTGMPSQHHGMDIAARIGSPVRAPADGVVVFASTQEGYGKVLIVDHGYETSTLYGHLSAIEVDVGQKVTRNMLMARVGNTGRSTAPHLHYEVRMRSVPVNPQRYILID